jgi:predicted enzyme related to lactoylglutathione lyase
MSEPFAPRAGSVLNLRRVQEEGGKVVKTVQGQDGASVYAAVQDPVGCL